MVENDAADDSGIRERLKDKTERIPLKALERRGFKSVQVLDMATIERIVGDAVELTFQRRHTTATEAERTALEKEAKSEFLKLLEDHKRLRQQKDEVDQRRTELEEQVGRLAADLQGQQRALSEERQRPVDAFAFTASAVYELESKIREIFKKLFREEQRQSLAEIGPKALKGLSAFEAELAGVIDRLLVDERARFLERERQEQQQKIELYERRIEKLNQALKDTESTLAKVAKAKGIDGGLASIYSEIQGLNLEDGSYERKSELLKEIFVQNLELQNKPVAADDLDGLPDHAVHALSAPAAAALAPVPVAVAVAAPPRARPAPAVAASASSASVSVGFGAALGASVAASAASRDAGSPGASLEFKPPLDISSVVTETAF